MILNKASNFRKKIIITLSLVTALFSSVSVYANSSSQATISPGSSTATGPEVAAPPGSTGTLEVQSSGPTFYVQGRTKQTTFLIPDSTVASGIGYPGQPYSSTFTIESGNSYYAEAVTQANSSDVTGFARFTINP